MGGEGREGEGRKEDRLEGGKASDKLYGELEN